MTYSFKDYLDIISECVTEMMDNSTKYDFLTSGEKNTAKQVCDEILSYAEDIIRLKRWSEKDR